MRVARVSSLAGLLGLHILGVYGKTSCYANKPLANWSTIDASRTKEALNGIVSDMCGDMIETDKVVMSSNVTLAAGEMMFTILDGSGIQDVTGCINAFVDILLQCFSNQNVAGGEFQSNSRVSYEIVYSNVEFNEGHDDNFRHSGLVSRAKKLASKRPPPNAVETKPKPKTTKPKPQPKPKPKPTKPNPKPTKPKVTKISTSAKASPTKNCKQIYDLALKESLASERKISNAPRDSFVERRGHIEKRVPKTSDACPDSHKVVLEALGYPTKSQMPKDALYYGYTQPEVCDAYAFTGWTKPRIVKQNAYQIEHILEWQLVAAFFTWINEKRIRGRPFDNPDSGAATQKLNFCGYWKETWSGTGSPKFQIGQSPPRNALEHLKYAYPGTTNYPEEFVWLETMVNSPGKSYMWSYKGGNLDTGIFDEDKITNEITGRPNGKFKLLKDADNTRKAIIKLRSLIGARKYMRHERIAKILGEQVNRMGGMIDKLDKAMEKQVRVHRTTGTISPWKSQHLKAFWDEYMNERFLVAQTRTVRDMDKYIALLQTHWAKNAPMRNEIAKLKAEWTKEKAIEWVRPW